METVRKKTKINLNLCILCQKRKNFKKDGRLEEPSEHGSDVLKAAYLRRRELANELGEPDERLTEIYETVPDVDFS